MMSKSDPIPSPSDAECERLDGPLADDLQSFRTTYEAMFGSVPPLPDAKLQMLGRLDPEATRLSEQLRADAFYSDVLDAKTTQLLLFAMMIATGAGAARHHAIAALRAGASYTELTQVLKLASAMLSLGPVNQGAALLAELAGYQPNDRR